MYDFKSEVLAIKHAPTIENKKDLCLGWIKTNTEKKELEKLTDSLIEDLLVENIECIITSELNRTKITAKYLNKYLQANEIYSDKSFNDINFGIYSKRKSSFIKKKQPEIYDDRGLFKYNISLIGGESLKNMEDRVKKGLNTLEQISKKGKILLVTHGSFITMMHKVFYDYDYNQIYLKLYQNMENKIFRFK